MKILIARKEDSSVISELLISLTKKFIATEFTKAGVDNIIHSMQPDAISNYFDQGYRYHLGEINNRVIGVVGTRDNNHLYHLFVKESEQGKGYSRELWEVAKAECLAQGNAGSFTVNSSLNAQEVYKSWGFVAIGGIRESGGVKDIPMKLVLSDRLET
jgi:GNAT superfamily N-acetyltransferase